MFLLQSVPGSALFGVVFFGALLVLVLVGGYVSDLAARARENERRLDRLEERVDDLDDD